MDDMVLTLTNRRAELGLSLRDVAQATGVGVGVATVHSWEHRHKVPSVEHARDWAFVLGYRLELRKVGES